MPDEKDRAIAPAGDGGKIVGVGADAARTDCDYDRSRLVYQLLDWGSPVLAFGVAKGFSLAPLKIPIAGTFPDELTVSIPQAANKTKIAVDTIVDRISWHLDNLNTPTSVFDAQQNYFFQQNSGIEALVKIVGAPRYSVADDFTPVTEIAGPTPGWILTWTEGMTVAFRATFPLPEVPMKATLTLHARTCRWEKLIRMDNDVAMRLLEECGWDCTAYRDKYCGARAK